MAEQWLALANGADAYFAMDHAVGVPNPIQHDMVLRFEDGSGGYLRVLHDWTREHFVEAHRQHKGKLDTLMVATMLMSMYRTHERLRNNWFLRLLYKKETKLCQAYLENMCTLFHLQLLPNGKGGVIVVPLVP
jgi:hypothetical protein